MMAEGFVQVAPDSTGKQIGNQAYTVPVGTVLTDGSGNQTVVTTPLTFFRQEVVSADPNDPQGLATVQQGFGGPSSEDYGLTVRLPPNQPDLSSMLAILADIDTVLNQMLGQGFMGASSGLVPSAGPRINTLHSPILSPDRAMPFVADRFGRQLVVPIATRDMSDGASVTITTATETVLQPADPMNFNDLVAIVISNTSATAVRVDIRDQPSTVNSPPSQLGVMSFQLPAGDMRGLALGSVLAYQSNANQAWTATVSSGVTDIRIWALFAQTRVA